MFKNKSSIIPLTVFLVGEIARPYAHASNIVVVKTFLFGLILDAKITKIYINITYTNPVHDLALNATNTKILS